MSDGKSRIEGMPMSLALFDIIGERPGGEQTRIAGMSRYRRHREIRGTTFQMDGRVHVTKNGNDAKYRYLMIDSVKQ
jgi:hypothetical protein